MAGIKAPVLGQLLPNGLEYGRSYLVEFESQSLWYETSLTITAHALRNRVKTEYHVLLHPPDEVREALRRLGCEARSFEEQGLLRILDTYMVTTGLAAPEKPRVGPDPYQTHSIDVSEWNKEIEHQIRDGFPEDQRKWLHVDDDTSVVLQYSEEKALLDRWRTRWIPYTRARELADLPSLFRETASPAFYTQFETVGD